MSWISLLSKQATGIEDNANYFPVWSRWLPRHGLLHLLVLNTWGITLAAPTFAAVLIKLVPVTDELLGFVDRAHENFVSVLHVKSINGATIVSYGDVRIAMGLCIKFGDAGRNVLQYVLMLIVRLS